MSRKRRNVSPDPAKDPEPESEDEEKLSQSQKMCFSQHAAEASQGIVPAKASEQRNFENIPKDQQEKLVSDLGRLILFKGLAGEAIDKNVVCKEAGIGRTQGPGAVFEEACNRLRNVFGFDLKRLPKWMANQKSTKKKYSERHYLITVEDDNTQWGEHSKALCSQHGDIAVDRGLLMVVLALTYCKGDLRADGSRWIVDADLYRLLNAIDENIPGEPPQPGPKKISQRVRSDCDDLAATPDIDDSLERFVKNDYLMKEKITEEQLSATPGADENTFLYALGPRTAVEIGRKQIVFFCAEILGAPVDDEMIQEIEREEEEQEVMEE